MRTSFYGSVFALVLTLIFAPTIGASVIVNGDFSSGLDAWSYGGPVSWDSGRFAVLEDDLQSGQAWLEQAFVIPALMQSLSFSYTLTLTPDGTSGGP